MSYLYASNLDPLDRRDQLEFQLDTGDTAILRMGHFYDLTVNELARARQFIVLTFSSSPSDEEPVGIIFLPVKGNPADGQIPLFDIREGAFVPGGPFATQDALDEFAINPTRAPYFAVGDGSTDDSTAMQSAWTAAGILGADIFLPPDRVFVVNNIQASSHTRLTGPGSIKQKTSSVAGDCALEVPVGVTDVTIERVEIDGNKTNQPDGAGIHGMRIAGERVTVQGCHVHDTEYNGVSFEDGAADVQVLDCFIHDCGTQNLADPSGSAWGHGVNGEGITGVLIQGNFIRMSGQHGVRGGGDNHYWSVHDNVFQNIGHDCFAAYNVGNTHLSFTDNQVNTTALAGTHIGGSDLTAADNTMENVGGGGVLFGSTPNVDPPASHGGSITGNIIRTTSSIAIETRNFSHVVVANNEVDQTALVTGVQVAIQSVGNYGPTPVTITDIVFNGNIVRGARGHGIQLSYAVNSSVTGGSISGSGSRGLRLSNCTGITVSGVSINNNGVDGIFSDGATVAPFDIIITGCTMRNNGAYGVRCDDGTKVTLTANAIRSNTSGQIALNGNEMVVTANSISGAGTGILLAAGVSASDPAALTKAIVSNNHLSQTTGTAIETRNFSQISISGNEIDNTGVGGVSQAILATGNYGTTPVQVKAISIQGNIIQGAAGAGAQVAHATNVAIANNTIVASGARGIRLAGVKQVAITGNLIEGNASGGVFSDGSDSVPSDIVVTGNVIINNLSTGFANGAGDRCVLSGNVIRGNTTAQVTLTGTNNVVDDSNDLGVAQTVVNSTNASFTLTPLTSARRVLFTAPLTLGRSSTLSTTNAQVGMTFRLTRTAASTGAFNIDFGPGLKNVAVSQWAEATFDGSAWVLTGFGSL